MRRPAKSSHRLAVTVRHVELADAKRVLTPVPTVNANVAQMMSSVAPLLMLGAMQMYMSKKADEPESAELTALERIAEESGFDVERLRLLESWAQSKIAAKQFPSVVVSVSRQGRLLMHEAYGETGGASLFAVRDMAGPIVAATLLSFVDDGQLSLDDAVAKYIPSLAGVRVHAQGHAEPMTLRHVLTDTAGFPSALPVRSADSDLRALDASAAAAGLCAGDEASFVDFVAKVQLIDQPGRRYRQTGLLEAVLGHVLCQFTGRPLEEVVRRRVLEPLGMVDTTWSASGGRVVALSQAMPYLTSRLWGNALTGEHDGHKSWLGWVAKPSLAEQCGLFSTALDLMKFHDMLLADGCSVSGARILSSENVRLMTTDQLPVFCQKGLADPVFNSHKQDVGGSGGLTAPQFGVDASGQGVGLGGMHIVTRSAKARLAGGRGTFSSCGYFGTEVWSDPTLHLTVFVGTQLFPTWALPDLRQEVAGCVYGALVPTSAAKYFVGGAAVDQNTGGMGGMMNMMMMILPMMGGLGGGGGLGAGVAPSANTGGPAQ